MAQDHYQILMAFSCVPGVNQPYEIDGVPYFDGALSDPVPIEKAFAEGCDQVVLILTKSAAIPRKPGKDRLLVVVALGFLCGKLDEMMTLCNPIIGGCFTLIILNLGAPLDYHLILDTGLFTAIYILARKGFQLAGELGAAKPSSL